MFASVTKVLHLLGQHYRDDTEQEQQRLVEPLVLFDDRLGSFDIDHSPNSHTFDRLYKAEFTVATM